MIKRLYELRDYQKEALGSLVEAFESGYEKIVRQQPTGTGKSIELLELIIRALLKGNKVLVLVPFPHLVENIAKYLKNHRIPYGICQGNKKFNPDSNQVIVACVATLHNRLEVFNNWRGLLLWDEAHHLRSATWEKCYQFFKNLPMVFYTATLTRLDGKGFENHADHLIEGRQVQWFIDQGYLADYEYETAPGIAVQLNGKSDQLVYQGELFDKPTLIGNLVETYKEKAYGLNCLVFAPTVDISKKIAEQYNLVGIPAMHLDATHSQKFRDKILSNWGKYFKVITQVNLFGEGFDPVSTYGVEIEALQLARFSQSTALVIQMWGRVLRPGKAIILDHVGLCGKHGFPSDYRKWSLQGLVDPFKFAFKCSLCQEIILQDKRQHRGEYHTCPSCGYIDQVPYPSSREQDEERTRGEYDTRPDEKLVTVTKEDPLKRQLTSICLRPASAFKRSRLCLEIPGLSKKHVIFITEALRYKPNYAHFLWNIYQVLHTPDLSDSEFEAKIEAKNVPWWRETYEKIHGIR